MSLDAQIESGLATLGLTLEAPRREALRKHLELVAKWNRVHNLTSVREPEQMVTLHLLDSLSIAAHLGGAKRVADIGTGGGFPGIPLAIVRPDVHFSLVESSHKKCAFLEQARGELALANVQVVCARVEQWHPEQPFDVVVSRAFAELADFVVQARHLVAPGGRMLAMKGIHPYDEIARVPAGHRASVIELAVPGLDAKRHLVTLEAA